ncbi:MAG: hypothetical protein LBI28_13240 [Treponema sp.]|nr:hypothetical protein [Treponema sp.]
MKIKYLLLVLLFLFSCSSENKKINEVEIIQGEFFKVDDQLLILNLPYKIDKNIKLVFDEDTPYAIDIIEIYADAKKLSYSDYVYNGHRERSYFRINPVSDIKNEYYISMFWYAEYDPKYRDWLCWNDGRGLIYRGRQPNGLPDFTEPAVKANTYELTKGMKHLVIRYRILLPYSSLTIDDLYNKTYENNFSDERIMVVDISDVFNL